MRVNMFYVNVLVICITVLQATASPASGQAAQTSQEQAA
jgi:hypothetical protein